MEYEELLHCIRAVAEVTGENELYVFGSQSAAMHFGTLPPAAAESSESDIMTVHNAESNSYLIDGALGEDTMFSISTGLVVDGIQLSSLTLPDDWRTRISSYTYETYDRTVHIFVPDVNDIAVAKLIAEREKDRIWLQAMHDANLIDVQLMDLLIWKLPISFEEASHAENMLQRIIDHNEATWRLY